MSSCTRVPAKAAPLRHVLSPSNFGLKFASRLKSLWIGRLGAHWLFDLEIVMGTGHLPRDKQVAEPTDESLSLLANALREDEPSLGSGEDAEDVYSLLEENPPRRERSAIGPHPR